MTCPKCLKEMFEIIELNLDVSKFTDIEGSYFENFEHYYCNNCKTLSCDLSGLSLKIKIGNSTYNLNITD